MSLLDISGVLEYLSATLFSRHGLIVLFSLKFEELLLLLLVDLDRSVVRLRSSISYLPFFTSGPPSLILSIRIPICDPLREGRTTSLSVSLPLWVLAEPPVAPQLISHTFPPLHLLEPLSQLGVVRVDVVARLGVVVGSIRYLR